MSRLVRLVAVTLVVACHRTPKPISIAPLPQTAYAHYLAGKHALYHDDTETATRELQAAAMAAPDQPMIAVELARSFAKLKRDTAARGVLAAARRKWPDHAQVWLASGELLEHATQYPDAIAAYRRAIELEPSEERAYVGLARTQMLARDGAAAERTLRALVKQVPDSVEGHYRLAQRLEQRGDRVAATGELRAVLEREPDHLDARLDLARTLRRMGKLREAVEQTRSAFDRAGQPMDIAEDLFWVLCEADDREGAIDLLTLLDDDRSDADALATVAQYQRMLGRTPESRLIAEHIKTMDVDAATIVHALSDFAEGLVMPAVTRALTVPKQSPRFGEAMRLAVVGLLAVHEPQRALELIISLKSTSPEWIYLEARARNALGESVTALVANLELFLQARLAVEQGDTTRALAILDPVLRDQPDHVAAHNLAGYLLTERNERLADAERYLAHARDLQPGDPQILDSWGWLLLKRGRVRDAIRALDRAHRFAPREPEILLHLATAWAADRAPKYALELLDRAVRLGPTPEVAARINALRAKLVLPSTP